MEDTEQLLLQLKSRFERVGIGLPKVEVRFQHLNVVPTDCKLGILSHLNLFSNGHQEESFPILHDLSGIIKPGRMTLLLGPPCSGKTTLLLSLAGRLDSNTALKMSGGTVLTYNGHGLDEFSPLRTVAYTSPRDLHLPELTVRETLAFSARCQGVGSQSNQGMLVELWKRETAANIKPANQGQDNDILSKALSAVGRYREKLVVDYIIEFLGLQTCADTVVGDQMTRGISGGQRKRLTIGEMLLGPARVLFMDGITTGLDSSTAFEIMLALQKYFHILNRTGLISLLQPEPEIYNLFDDIVLMSQGHIIYQGPREYVLDFFGGLGFRCPERRAVADFLQEVTSRKEQVQYWAPSAEPYRFVSAEEFAEAFKSFHVGDQIRQELTAPYDRSESLPNALVKNKYSIGKQELLNACFWREYLILKRNLPVHIFKLFQLIVMGFMMMTIYPKTNMPKNSISDGMIYMGSLFYTVSRMLVNEFGEASLVIMRLPVFFKQRDHFFSAWAYALPSCIMKLLASVIDVGIWVFSTYYVIGYDPNVGRMFRQFLALLLLNYMSSGLFRFIGVVSRNTIVAQPVGSSVFALLIGLGGFILSRENVKKWWIWGYWSSPLMYATNSLAANEFLGQSWSHISPNISEPLGVLIMKFQGLYPHAYWYWLGVGVLFGFTLLFNVLYTLALTYVKPFQTHTAPAISNFTSEEETVIAETHFNDNVEPQYQPRVILEFEKHHLTFDQLTYSIDKTQGSTVKIIKKLGTVENKLELLKSVSGSLRPSVLTAVMGESGSGKTTLLDVLAGRKTGGYVEGRIKISGYTKKQKAFTRIFGYCEQNDVHSPHVSVYESLLFSAWLRLSPEVDPQTRKVYIEEIMELVELTQLSESLVGLVGINGLSTEQRKKLTIAVELVANPSIMFLDEPTTGLDSRAVSAVMKVIRNIADMGRTVACTIHQPSVEIFEAFDELILLKQGGQQIFAGPLLNHSCDLINYFEGIQGVNKIQDGYNPATWALESTTRKQELSLGIDFAEIYKNSDLYRRNKALIQELMEPCHGSKELSFPSQFALPLFKQYVACLWKQHRSYRHNLSYNGVRLLVAASQALLFGTVFWDLGKKLKTVQDLNSEIGSMFCVVAVLSMQNIESVIPVVATERTVFYRERAIGMYSALMYAIAQASIEIPYVLLQAIVNAALIYLMIGFEWTAAKFFWYLFFVFFTFLYMTFFGMMTMALSAEESTASTASAFVFSLWNLFTGFIIPRPRIPIWWRWYYWASPLAWTMYGLVASQLGNIKDLLDEGITVEQFVRDNFGYDTELLGLVATVIVGFAALFACVFALAIKIFNFERR